MGQACRGRGGRRSNPGRYRRTIGEAPALWEVFLPFGSSRRNESAAGKVRPYAV